MTVYTQAYAVCMRKSVLFTHTCLIRYPFGIGRYEFYVCKLRSYQYLFSFTHQGLKIPPLQETYLIYPEEDRLEDGSCLGFLKKNRGRCAEQGNEEKDMIFQLSGLRSESEKEIVRVRKYDVAMFRSGGVLCQHKKE